MKTKQKIIDMDSMQTKQELTFSFMARMMPLNVAATSVKLAIPPPTTRARL